jgi:hypothetical protein
MAITPHIVPPPPPDPTIHAEDDFVGKIVQAIVDEIFGKDSLTKKLLADAIGKSTDTGSAAIHIGVALLDALIDKVGEAVNVATPHAGILAASTINSIIGGHLDPLKIKEDFEKPATRASVVDIGKQFHEVIERMFPIEPTATAMVDRGNRGFAEDNINAYFGTNITFQLRSLAISTVASLIPGLQLEHLAKLHEAINWAFGFGWLSWTVMSSVMDVTTTKPMREKMNAQIKPNDYSESEAYKARAQDRITEEVFNKVLDNQGERDDIRATKLDMHRPDITERDITDLWEHGRYSNDDIRLHFIRKGFDGPNADRKTYLVEHDREFRLEKQLTESYLMGYVRGTVTVDDVRTWLNSLNYSERETELTLRSLTIRQDGSKGLTKSDLHRAIRMGIMSVGEVYTYLTQDGFTPADAFILITEFMG